MRLAYLNRGKRRPRSSGASVEVDGAVGVLGEAVVGVVGAVVVPSAEQDQVLEGRGSACCPGGAVVSFGPGDRPVAMSFGAGPPAHAAGDPVVSVEQPLFAADVEDDAVAVKDDGDDPGLARQPARLTRGDQPAGV